MKFIIGDIYRPQQAHLMNFRLISSEGDESLLYPGHGDFSVYLGNSWRFELVVDSKTGECRYFQTQLFKMTIECVALKIPISEKRNLHFVNDESMSPYSGCHYHPFSETAYFDNMKNVLCFGTPNTPGQAIEFSPNIIAIIHEAQLKCIYLQLNNLSIESIFRH